MRPAVTDLLLVRPTITPVFKTSLSSRKNSRMVHKIPPAYRYCGIKENIFSFSRKVKHRSMEGDQATKASCPPFVTSKYWKAAPPVFDTVCTLVAAVVALSSFAVSQTSVN